MCFIELMGFYQTSEPLRKRSGALRPVENLANASRAEQSTTVGELLRFSPNPVTVKAQCLLARLMFVGKIHKRTCRLKGLN